MLNKIVTIFIILLVSGCSLIQSKPDKRPWHLDRINLHNAHSITKGENSIVVVCDSGVSDQIHQIKNLERKHFNGHMTDFYLKDIVTPDLHGTLVASIIGGRVHGIAPNAKIISFRISDEANGGADKNDIRKCIEYAINIKADVLNLSYRSLCFDIISDELIERAVKSKLILVSSAGNDMSRVRDSIKDYRILCTSSTSYMNENRLSYISNWGDYVDIAAPGEKIISYNGIEFRGTSSAAPIVSGVIALLKSVNKELDINDIEYILQQTSQDFGDPGKDDKFGYGIINADAAVMMALSFDSK